MVKKRDGKLTGGYGAAFKVFEDHVKKERKKRKKKRL